MALSTEACVREHVRALLAREMGAVIDGYADDAVILVAPAPAVGKAAIAGLFAAMPVDAAPPDVVIDHLLVEGDHALLTYHDSARAGADSFVVRDGKIVMQSVYIAAR